MHEGRDPIRDMILESGLDADEYADVADALATLRSTVPAEAPAPSAELASLLGGVTVLRPRRNTVAIASGVAAAVILGGGVAAAASNNLPEPLQRFVHDVSDKVLPFEFPSPEGRQAQGREGPVQLPEQARNDTDQGKHVGRGSGGGKTGNPGQDETKAPDEPTVPDEAQVPDNPGKPDALPTTPPPPPTPVVPEPPDKRSDKGSESSSTSRSGSKPTDPGPGEGKGKSGDGSARRG